MDTELVTEIYQAALDDCRWPRVAELIARRFEGKQSIIHLPGDSHQSVSVVTYGIEHDIHQRYLELLEQDLWLQRMRRLPHGSVCRSEELLDPRDLESSLFYNELCAPAGVYHMGGVAFFPNQGPMAGFATQREKRAGRFDASERRALNALGDHFERALFMRSRLRCLQDQVDSLRASLDRIKIAIALVNGNGKLAWFNRAFKKILDQKDAIYAAEDRLQARSPEESQQLRALLKDAANASLSGRMKHGGSLSIARRSLKRALQVMVAPLPSKVSAWETDATAVVFVVDPDDPPELSLEAFKSLYGLTPAEGRICQQLLKGRSLAEAADCLSISVNTARTQLKSILRKCEVPSQSQLMGRLLRSCLIDAS